MADSEDNSCFMDNRDNIVGFDFSSPEYDALFTRHDAFHRFASGLMTYQTRMEEHLRADSNVSEAKQLEARVNRMRSEALEGFVRELAFLKLRMAFTDKRDLAEQTKGILGRIDPFARGHFYSQLIEHVEQSLRLVGSFMPALSLLVGEEVATAQLKPAVAGLLFTYTELEAGAADGVWKDTLRSLKGYPAWDSDAQEYVQDETLYVPPQPPFFLTEAGEIVEGPAVAQRTPSPTATTDDEHALLARLFDGITFE